MLVPEAQPREEVSKVLVTGIPSSWLFIPGFFSIKLITLHFPRLVQTEIPNEAGFSPYSPYLVWGSLESLSQTFYPENSHYHWVVYI